MLLNSQTAVSFSSLADMPTQYTTVDHMSIVIHKRTLCALISANYIRNDRAKCGFMRRKHLRIPHTRVPFTRQNTMATIKRCSTSNYKESKTNNKNNTHRITTPVAAPIYAQRSTDRVYTLIKPRPLAH